MENLTITKNRLARHPKLPKNDPFVSIISVQTPSQTPCLVRVPALRGISATDLSYLTTVILTVVGAAIALGGLILAIFRFMYLFTRDMRKEFGELRTELKGDMDSLRIEFKDDMDSLRTELKGDMDSLRTELKGDMDSLRIELKDDMDSLRTELKGDMDSLRTELKGDMDSLRTELKDENETQYAELKGDIDSIRTELKGVQIEVQKLNVNVARNDGTLQTLLQVMTDRRAA